MPTAEERKMHFVYVRYHLTGLFGPRVPNQILPHLKETQRSRMEEPGYTWAIGDVGQTTINGAQLLYGRLGKTAHEIVETHYDEKSHSFRREQVQSLKAAYSNFFIEPHSSILALEDKQLLPRGKFLKMFKRFWEAVEPSEIDFDFIKNEVEIFEVIRHWDKVTTASFDLSPTNPHPREDFSPLDDIIKKAKSRRAKLKFEGQQDGLAKNNSIVQQGTSMAAAGYGEFSLKGLEHGSTRVLNSNSLLVTHELVRVDDLVSLSPEMMAEIRKIVEVMHHGKTKT